MLSRKSIHNITFLLGLVLLLYSIYLALAISSPHFYTGFALGTWLVLDYIDYKLTRYSTLGYFIRHDSWGAFLFFFISAGFFLLFNLISYMEFMSPNCGRGERYGVVEFARMLLIMNASFIFSVVELFRVIEHFTKKVIPAQKLSTLQKPTQVSNCSVHFVLGYRIGCLCVGACCCESQFLP